MKARESYDIPEKVEDETIKTFAKEFYESVTKTIDILHNKLFENQRTKDNEYV